ncbi:aminotransferase class IV [Clostridium pasteurianum]|uniref:Branched-chain amino acid aminotransferase/4-amino-4-deoxychorismate lyase n=1 Tax=Clostridium pasteurianum BC1 TaxID=86416 RepID=R4K3V3_CLOPA|nr:aminotransferase class IV [Clostridium pasteurianum]AGK97812.1 branched-chain amino acid aminotransferase/4-amino-4-deoxychorismate lyase [Clostridium pasteurianum BC1]
MEDISYREFYIQNDEIKQKDSFNGEFITLGKSLYEVIRIEEGVPLFVEKNLKRLENSAKITNLILSISPEEIRKKINKLIQVNDVKIGNIKIVFNFFKDKCNFYAYFLKHNYPTKDQYDNGVDTIFFHGERRNPNAKIVNTEFRASVEAKMKENNAYEALLVDRNGNITEGSRSNIFMVKDKTVYTAPLEDVLPGTTRDSIIEVALKCGYEFKEKRINYKDVTKIDGMFISGTLSKVLPIRRIGTIQLNSSKNAAIRNIMAEYDKMIKEYITENRLLKI